MHLGGPLSVGFSFAPSGLCFPYSLGAASVLVERGAVTPETPLAGSSGGALVAAVAALDLLEESLEAALRVNAYCRERGTARFQLRDALVPELDGLLGDDVVERLNGREAKVGVGILRFRPFPRGDVVTDFRDLDDLKAALLATSCIPLYFSRSPVAVFRGWPAVDGFFGSPREYFGAPNAPNATVTVRIAPFSADRVRLEGLAISPPDTSQTWADDDSDEAATPGNPGTKANQDPQLSDLLKCALGLPPVDDDFLLALFDRGKRDADDWLDAGGLQQAIDTASELAKITANDDQDDADRLIVL